MARYNALGQELPEDTPVEWPLGVRRPETLQEQMRRLIRTEMSTRAAAEGYETFEEANDFDVDDDQDLVPPTKHELLAEAAELDPVLTGSPGEPVPPPPVDKTGDEKSPPPTVETTPPSKTAAERDTNLSDRQKLSESKS
ncbi:hypothetical protein [robinz microvirus RP_153]|nr:hypothetical protein [robinz microvirus RP_153]